MDEGYGLDAVVDGDAKLDDHGVHGILQHVAGSVRGITGAPLGGAAKGPLGDEAFFFRQVFNLLAVRKDLFTGHDPGPGNAPMRQLADGNRGQVDEEAGHVLIAAPIRAFDRIFKMDVGIVAVAHGHVAQGGLHAALRRGAVGTAGRHQA